MVTKVCYGKDGQNYIYSEYLASDLSDIQNNFISSTPGNIVYLPGGDKFIMYNNVWHAYKTNQTYKNDIVQPLIMDLLDTFLIGEDGGVLK